MMNRNKISFRALAIGGIAGWVVLIALAGVFIIFRPEPSELGRAGFFLVWSALLSIFYVADFLLITVPIHIILHSRLSSTRRLLWSTIGGLLFALSVPLWNLIARGPAFQDIVILGGLGFISGGASFFATAHLQGRTQAGSEQVLLESGPPAKTGG